ncbi:ribonuclease H1 precursor [Mucor ambiguus]|uniref:Ribonuclease H n=1 Tax=Mucor ambiguus TaxID=91626 RepID=A0A0C9N1A2_9FUNG|nr:ribonuclease H1 precursor [Mucor ambiguus]
MGSKYYYAVMIGKEPGVYMTWPECQAQVKGFRNAQYKKFPTMEEAQAFVDSGGPAVKFNPPEPEPKFQATRVSISSQNKRESPFASDDIIPITRILPKRSRESSNISSSNSHSERPSKFQNTGLDRKPSYAKKEPYAVVYTDGASSNNGKHHARAGYGVYWGDNDPRNVSARLKGERQTNQRAEAMAVLRVLEDTKNSDKPLEIRTDSQYVINAVTVWYKNWVKKSWIASNGREVQNRDLFEPIVNLVKNRKADVKFTYVPGHSGFEGNEEADRLAVAGALLEN